MGHFFLLYIGKSNMRRVNTDGTLYLFSVKNELKAILVYVWLDACPGNLFIGQREFYAVQNVIKNCV